MVVGLGNLLSRPIIILRGLTKGLAILRDSEMNEVLKRKTGVREVTAQAERRVVCKSKNGNLFEYQ